MRPMPLWKNVWDGILERNLRHESALSQGDRSRVPGRGAAEAPTPSLKASIGFLTSQAPERTRQATHRSGSPASPNVGDGRRQILVIRLTIVCANECACRMK